jgi:ATP-dependent DNA ligase
MQLDGELILVGRRGLPDFRRLCRRMLHRDLSIPVTYMAFDVLALDGEPTVRLRTSSGTRYSRSSSSTGLRRRCSS